MHKNRMSIVLASAFLLSFSNLAGAATLALTDPIGTHAGVGLDLIFGWTFSVNAPITVTSLGLYDQDDFGLFDTHEVGLFRLSDQSLMGSVAVPAGTCGTVLDHFCFENVSPFDLAEGTYVVVMTMPKGTADSQVILATSFSTPSEITYITSVLDPKSTLTFPSSALNGVLGPGMFGPNFTFTSAPVPEPSTCSAIGAEILALLALARRRNR